jgi:hypothetical protein
VTSDLICQAGKPGWRKKENGMSDELKNEPKEIESLNQEDLDVEAMTPEDLEQVSGGEDPDLCVGFSCGVNSEK